MCIPTEETFQKVKRLYNLCTCVCASGGDNNRRGEETGGGDGVISFVCLCFRFMKQCQAPPEAVCVSVCVRLECVFVGRHKT